MFVHVSATLVKLVQFDAVNDCMQIHWSIAIFKSMFFIIVIYLETK